MSFRPSTEPQALPAAESALQLLAYEALDDAWTAAGQIFNDVEAGVAVACTQAIVLALGDLTSELRAVRTRADRALEIAFGSGDSAALESELHPNGEGYRSAGS